MSHYDQFREKQAEENRTTEANVKCPLARINERLGEIEAQLRKVKVNHLALFSLVKSVNKAVDDLYDKLDI